MEQEQLQQAIAHLETQRAVLGNAVVDVSIAALRKQLTELDAILPPAGQARKQITVLFADLSGFTALGETMDAEDLTERINMLWRRLDAAIVAQGGHIDKHIGDAVMALWGVEQAREDDPERAIRAALAMQDELRAAAGTPQAALQMRIGLHTGPVLLGAVGTTAEYTAMGDTVNLASRLQNSAPLGGVLISHDTYRHVRGLFEVQSLAPLTIRGKAEPMRAYAVLGARPRAFHLGTRGVEGIETPMVGRDAELRRLQEAFHRAVAERAGQAVLICGEAGVGKSRLLFEFEQWLELLPQQVRYFKGRASLESQRRPYALLRDLLAFRFGILDSDPAQVAREKLEAGLAATLGPASAMQAHILGQWVGFDFSASPHLAGVWGDAQQLRDRGLLYLGDYFQAVAAAAPAVILLEDLHWVDDSSLEVIVSLARDTATEAQQPAALLIVGAARPALDERQLGWGPGFVRLDLAPLSADDSRRLVAEILCKVPAVPETLRDLVVGGAEGNPFYLEELVKMLIEDGVVVKGEERWHVELERLTALRVPATLTGVLQARLDSLPAGERRVLQQAAVVGRTFWEGTVAHIHEHALEPAAAGAAQAVPPALSALRGREMVFPRPASAFAETPEYIFKHAVLREVTYESVLKRLRRVYHGLVADWLIARGSERAGEFAGLIAEHLERAGRAEEARGYFRRAGDEAAARYANAEAVGYFSRALELAPPEDLAGRCDLLGARVEVYHRQGAREAQCQDLAAIKELAEALGDDRRQLRAALGQADYAEATGNYAAEIRAAQEAIRLGEALQDLGPVGEGCLHWGRALVYQGDLPAARRRLEQALARAREARAGRVEAGSLHTLGLVCFEQGDLAGTQAYGEQALALHRAEGDIGGQSVMLNNLGLVALLRGDCVQARTLFEQVLAGYRQVGTRKGESMALDNISLTYSMSDRGDYAQARAYAERSLRIHRQVADRRGEGVVLNALALACLEQNDYSAARSWGEQALPLVREIGDRRDESWTLGLLCAALAHLGDYARAQVCGQEALRLAQEMGSRSWESWALAYLGQLAHDAGDDEAGRAYSAEGLRIAREMGFHYAAPQSACALGHALAGLGRWDEAANAYRQALVGSAAEGWRNWDMAPLAGLARIALAQSDRTQAQAHVEEILHFVAAHGLDGTREPLRIYWTCFQILQAGGDARAPILLRTAHGLLQEWAARIPDEEGQRLFLDNVAVHREIAAAWHEEEGKLPL